MLLQERHRKPNSPPDTWPRRIRTTGPPSHMLSPVSPVPQAAQSGADPRAPIAGISVRSGGAGLFGLPQWMHGGVHRKSSRSSRAQEISGIRKTLSRWGAA